MGGEFFYNGLHGRLPTSSQLEGGAALGAVFGLAGGFGEFGTSADSGGLGFGRAFDAGAKDVFDLAVGAIAAASGNVLG